MKTLSYTESRARYAEVLDSVVNDREEVVITRAGHEPVVMPPVGTTTAADRNAPRDGMVNDLE
jgi:prevent-host-death family protein